MNYCVFLRKSVEHKKKTFLKMFVAYIEEKRKKKKEKPSNQKVFM
jgi:hypothetical protein